MIGFFKAWMKSISQTPAEKYLAQSHDLCELELRMKELRRKGIWL